MNHVFDHLNRIATLLFGMTQFTIVAANPSTFFDQRDGWSCCVHVCIANRIMNAKDLFNWDNLLNDMHAVRQWKQHIYAIFSSNIDGTEAIKRQRKDHQQGNETTDDTEQRRESD